MTDAFVAGLLAGYAIAVPVGAIAVLILEISLREGWRAGMAAGTGAASADAIYATLAVTSGLALGPLITPIETPLRVVAVVVLVVLAVRGLLQILRARHGGGPEDDRSRSVVHVYLRLLGLTLLNPATVIYFAALVVGLPAVAGGDAGKVAFVAGAAGASLSWQWLLASVAAVLRSRTSPRLITISALAGNLIILGFAARIAVDLIPKGTPA